MSEEYFESLERKELLNMLDKLENTDSVVAEWLEERINTIKSVLKNKYNWIGDDIANL